MLQRFRLFFAQIGRPTDCFIPITISVRHPYFHDLPRHPLWDSMFPTNLWILLEPGMRVLTDLFEVSGDVSPVPERLSFATRRASAEVDDRLNSHGHRQTRSLIGARAPSSR